MATIHATITSPASPQACFDHVADFTTTADWDPGITSARRLDDGPIHLGSRFEVGVRLGVISVPFVYEITVFEPGERVVLTTHGLAHHGVDDVRFAPAADGGTEVTWNAEFRVRGPGRLIDPALGVGFRRVAKAAVAGLEQALQQLGSPAER